MMLSAPEAHRVLHDLDVRVERRDRLPRRSRPWARRSARSSGSPGAGGSRGRPRRCRRSRASRRRRRPGTAPRASRARRRRAAAPSRRAASAGPRCADLGEQQVARVALALLGGQRPRGLDLVAAVLPQREAAGHRLDVLVAEILDQRPRRPRRAVAGLRSRGSRAGCGRARRPRSATRGSSSDVLGAGNVARRPTPRARARRRRPRRWSLLAHDRRIDLVDPALDLAENLSSGRAHRENSSKAVWIQYFSRV